MSEQEHERIAAPKRLVPQKDHSSGNSFAVRAINSVGFWMVVFSAFGLLSLMLGEARIQKRMFNQQMKTALPYPSPPQTESETGGGEIETSERPDTRSTTLDPKAIKPYRLTGLRWILTIAVVVGLIFLVKDVLKRSGMDSAELKNDGLT